MLRPMVCRFSLVCYLFLYIFREWNFVYVLLNVFFNYIFSSKFFFIFIKVVSIIYKYLKFASELFYLRF